MHAHLFKRLEHAADAVVHREKCLAVIFVKLLDVDAAVIREVDAVPTVALILEPTRLAVVVRHRVGLRLGRHNFRIGIRAAMPLRRRELRVHRLMREVQKKRLVPLAAAQPVHRVVGQLVGDVALLRHLFAVDVEAVTRRQIRALPTKTHPMVEPRPGLVGAAAHVPLADVRRLVAGLLQMLRKENRPLRHKSVVVDHAMFMRVKPSENRRAARRTKRRGDKRILEMHAVPGDRVEMRRLQKRMPHETHRVVPMIVGQDENDIARLGTGHALDVQLVGGKRLAKRSQAKRGGEKYSDVFHVKKGKRLQRAAWPGSVAPPLGRVKPERG